MLYTVTDFSNGMFLFPASNEIMLSFVFLQLICKRSEEMADFLKYQFWHYLSSLSSLSPDLTPLFSSLFFLLSSLFFPLSLCVHSFFTSYLITFTFSRPSCWPCLSEGISEVLLVVTLLWWLWPWFFFFTSSCPKRQTRSSFQGCAIPFWRCLAAATCQRLSWTIVLFWCHEPRYHLTRWCTVI